MNAVDQLCPNCGLCCDSTLFADVELRARARGGDDAKRLAGLGLSLVKKGKSKVAFAQPCACFDGKWCRIYADRPKRCQLFECGLLKKVQAGEMSAGAALKKIAQGKELAGRVKELLALFPVDEGVALSERYSRAMSEPVDLSEGDASHHGKLMQAYEALMQTVRRDFLR
jgi:Fe-S-cluster containining protein